MSVLNLHSSSIPNPNVFFIFIIHYRLIFALEYRHESAEVARKLPLLMSAKGPQKWRWKMALQNGAQNSLKLGLRNCARKWR